MKLASYNDGSRDGQLVVVSRDLGSAHYASGIATRLQQVLDDWNFLSPQLQTIYDALNQGRARHAFPFEPSQCMAPLPRAYQRVSGSAYPSHAERLAAARGERLPEGWRANPVLTQRSGDDLAGAHDGIVLSNLALGVDFGVQLGVDLGAELAVITGDVAMGASADTALDGVRLVMLANDVRLHELAAGGAEASPAEESASPIGSTADTAANANASANASAGAGAGADANIGADTDTSADAGASSAGADSASAFTAPLAQNGDDAPGGDKSNTAAPTSHPDAAPSASPGPSPSPSSSSDANTPQRIPATAYSPVAVTPDELGVAWKGGRLLRPVSVRWNSKRLGVCEAGADMTFSFARLIAELARARPVRAGTILSSGPISNRDAGVGHSSLAEKRSVEFTETGTATTPFMAVGDSLTIDMKDTEGRSIFGAISQQISQRNL
jgi:2-keto-4-pentenoate hydratase/2-oxohepta-3-ene-1,7-dioic acid hydratase in catechol pathway